MPSSAQSSPPSTRPEWGEEWARLMKQAPRVDLPHQHPAWACSLAHHWLQGTVVTSSAPPFTHCTITHADQAIKDLRNLPDPLWWSVWSAAPTNTAWSKAVLPHVKSRSQDVLKSALHRLSDQAVFLALSAAKTHNSPEAFAQLLLASASKDSPGIIHTVHNPWSLLLPPKMSDTSRSWNKHLPFLTAVWDVLPLMPKSQNAALAHLITSALNLPRYRQWLLRRWPDVAARALSSSEASVVCCELLRRTTAITPVRDLLPYLTKSKDVLNVLSCITRSKSLPLINQVCGVYAKTQSPQTPWRDKCSKEDEKRALDLALAAAIDNSPEALFAVLSIVAIPMEALRIGVTKTMTDTNPPPHYSVCRHMLAAHMDASAVCSLLRLLKTDHEELHDFIDHIRSSVRSSLAQHPDYPRGKHPSLDAHLDHQEISHHVSGSSQPPPISKKM